MTLAPGRYEGIDNADYHAWDAVGSTSLKTLWRLSPAHTQAKQEVDDDAREAMDFGTAAHAALLEPGDFAERYVVGPDVDLRTKEGKARWADFCGENAGKSVLRGADGRNIVGIHKAIWAHAKAARLLSAATEREVSYVWTDDETGLVCKCRPDLYGSAILTDLKTAKLAKPDAFQRAAWDFGYHIQLAFYSMGLTLCKQPVENLCIIAVEKTAPFAVCVFEPDDDWLEAGWRIMRLALNRYAECQASGVWPGYADSEIVRLSLPRWAAATL